MDRKREDPACPGKRGNGMRESDAVERDRPIGGYDVALAACDRYEDLRVEAALRSALDAVDGLAFVRPGMRIAVKANLVTALKPDTAATVHPAVVCALTRILRELGAEVVIGDGPGGIYGAAYLRVVYDVSGMRRAEAFGAKLNDDFSVAEVEYPEAVMAKRFPYTAYLSKADAIIDLCKLKTHGMMGLTCAVKNFFGSIPGTQPKRFFTAHDMPIMPCVFSLQRSMIASALLRYAV